MCKMYICKVFHFEETCTKNNGNVRKPLQKFHGSALSIGKLQHFQHAHYVEFVIISPFEKSVMKVVKTGGKPYGYRLVPLGS